MAQAPTGPRTGKVAGPSRSRLLRVPRSADRDHSVWAERRAPAPAHAVMAPLICWSFMVIGRQGLEGLLPSGGARVPGGAV